MTGFLQVTSHDISACKNLPHIHLHISLSLQAPLEAFVEEDEEDYLDDEGSFTFVDQQEALRQIMKCHAYGITVQVIFFKQSLVFCTQ